jgi:neurofibromin 1
VAEDEVLVDILLDELVRAAVAPEGGGGAQQQQQQQQQQQRQSSSQHHQHAQYVGGQQQTAGQSAYGDALAAIVASVGTLTLRGRIVSKLRKALNRSSLSATRHLTDNPVWPEICVLVHYWLALSFNSGPQAQLFMPETFHVVTILANTGPPHVRLMVYRLLVNTLHAACATFDIDEAQQDKLRASMALLSEQRAVVGGVDRPDVILVRGGAGVEAASGGGGGGGGTSDRENRGGSAGAGQTAASALPTLLPPTETLAAILYDVCAFAAPSTNLMNGWRARWMGLVASTAFQTNPAIQPRAFAVMGCLARDEVDDDLLYQVLVALRHSLARLREDNSADMLVAVVQSLSKMMAKLPSASRYGLQLFWLAMSLVRLVPVGLFNCAAAFLEAVLANNSTDPDFCGYRMPAMLLHARGQMGDAAVVLDKAYGVHFREGNFEFAVCASLLRGLTDPSTRATTLRVLAALLGLMVRGEGLLAARNGAAAASGEDGAPSPAAPEPPATVALELLSPLIVSSPFLHLILARAASADEVRDCLWLAGVHARSVKDLFATRAILLDYPQHYHNLHGDAAGDGGDAAAAAATRRDGLGMQRRGSMTPDEWDRSLLLNTAMELVDFDALEDGVQARTLAWLIELAKRRAGVMACL